MRPATSRSALMYFVPRKWFRGVVFLALVLAIVGIVLLLQEAAIVLVWASSTKQSTQQLEAMIPREVNMKVRWSPGPITNPADNSSLSVPTENPTAQCRVTYPRVLLFIRMPKCASTSFMSLFQSLAKPLAFQLHFDPSGAHDWKDSTIKKETELIKSKSHKRKLLYARHFYYTDFEHYGLTNYTYLTVIREPMARFISSYLYYHYSSKPYIQRMLKPRYKKESLLECLSRGHNGCAHNWLTKYFCGHQRLCRNGNRTALTMAKANMKLHFAAVGIIEDMDLTLKVFAKVVPGYVAWSNDLPQSNKNERSMHLSVEEDEAVRMANTADIELYDYARELLQATATSCHIQ